MRVSDARPRAYRAHTVRILRAPKTTEIQWDAVLVVLSLVIMMWGKVWTHRRRCEERYGHIGVDVGTDMGTEVAGCPPSKNYRSAGCPSPKN